jgi:ribonuclease P protein component
MRHLQLPSMPSTRHVISRVIIELGRRLAGEIGPVGLSSPVQLDLRQRVAKLETLKDRAEFQRVRGGTRVSTSCFLLEAKARPAQPVRPGSAMPTGSTSKPAHYPDGPRFGFTITKKIGGAVQRNRMRRRSKDAVGRLQGEYAKSGFDYVIVARVASLDCPFAALVADVRTALVRAHRPEQGGRSRAT